MRFGLLMATVLVMLPLSAQAQEKQADVTANSLMVSSKGMLDWMKEGYSIDGATLDMIILKGELRKQFVLCKVRNGGGRHPTDMMAPGSLDVSLCYEPKAGR